MQYLVKIPFTLDRLYVAGEIVELSDKSAKDLKAWGNIIEAEEPPEIKPESTETINQKTEEVPQKETAPPVRATRKVAPPAPSVVFDEVNSAIT